MIIFRSRVVCAQTETFCPEMVNNPRCERALRSLSLSIVGVKREYVSFSAKERDIWANNRKYGN